MKALALHLGHNATAAIMEDGAILGVLSQEKIDGIKNSAAFPVGAAEALCGRLATEALDRVEAMLLKAVRARYNSEKERMVEMALQTVAEEG